MKKIYSLLALALSAAALNAQMVNLTFQVDMKNETPSKNGVTVPGNWQVAAGGNSDWTPGAAEALLYNTSGTIWSKTVSVPQNSTFEYKYLNNNDWASGGENVPTGCQVGGGNSNRQVTVGTSNLTINLHCFSSCTACPSSVYKRNVTFKVIDLNKSNPTFAFTDVKLKGAFSGWSDFVAYDDGTNGDATSGDGTWTAKYNVAQGSHEWGGTDKGGWFISGPNKMFTMDSLGSITGDTTYTVAALGALISVTFNVDMSDTIVNSEGVYVTGNWLSKLESPINNWNKDTLILTKGANGIYSKTVKLYADDFQYKFYNGKGNADDSRGENWITAACGTKDGQGVFNRALGLKGRTKDTTMPVYMWNRCATSTVSNKTITAGELTVAPNPAYSVINVSLSSSKLINVKLISLDGRVIMSQSNASLEIQNVAKGMYLVNVTDNLGRVGTTKVMIK